VYSSVGGYELGVFLVVYGLGTVGILGVLGRLLGVLGTQPVADIGVAELEIAVLGDKSLLTLPVVMMWLAM
jgi:hypothetical protein